MLKSDTTFVSCNVSRMNKCFKIILFCVRERLMHEPFYILCNVDMERWQRDVEDMKANPNDFGPGELKEKLKRLLKAGRRCSCWEKNCFDFT